MTSLFITHYAGFYGANKSLLTLMLLLREKYGVRPLVLLPTEGPMCNELQKAGIEYKVSHYYWWVNYNHGVFQWMLNKRKQWRNLFRIKRLCALFSNEPVDLIYTNSVCVNVGAFMAKRMRVPHIWQFRESLSLFSLSLSLSLSRRMLTSVVNKRFILISDYMMDYYKPYLPVNRMVRIYNGIDVPKGMERKSENKLGERLQIACVGILSEQKNQLELLKAQRLLLQRNVLVETWFVGSGKKDYFEKVQDYVEANGMQKWVHFVGHSNQVFSILQRMNLGVVAANDEAFGRVTVEYMLMRMPVVASRSGANSELIEVGVTGDTYEYGNVEELADKIEIYVKHPELLEIQGTVAARKAVEGFSAESNAKMIYEQIENVIKED